MPHSYTAKPRAEATPFGGPPGWNPIWPYPGPLPPGYTVPSPKEYTVDDDEDDPPPSTYRIEASLQQGGTSHIARLRMQSYASPASSPVTYWDPGARSNPISGEPSGTPTRDYIEASGNSNNAGSVQSWLTRTYGADFLPATPGMLNAWEEFTGEQTVLGIDPIREDVTHVFYLDADNELVELGTVDATFTVYIYGTGWVPDGIGSGWIEAEETLIGTITKTLTGAVGYEYTEPRGWFTLYKKVTPPVGDAEQEIHTIIVTEQWANSDATPPYLV